MRNAASLAAGLDRASAVLAKAAACLAGFLLVAMIVHVILEILLRGLFATSTFALDEFVGYGVAAVTFLAAGYAFQDGAFIRVSFLLQAAGRRRPALLRAVESLCATVAAACLWFVAWYFARSVLRHLERGTLSETVAQVPLWIPEGLMLVGLVVLSLRISLYLLRLLCGGPLLVARRE